MRLATTHVTMRVGVSYTSVSPLPDPLRAIGGLFSAALSVASRRLVVNQHPVLWSSDFPLGSQPSDRLSPPLCRRWDSNPHAVTHQILSLASLPIPPRRHMSCHRRESNPHALRHQHLKLACLPFHHDDMWCALPCSKRRLPVFCGSLYQLSYQRSATGGTRTHTPLRAQRSRRCASANSATVA